MFGLYEMAFGGLTWGNILMLLIGGGLIYLGAAKKMEPILLVPIGIGVILVNIPSAGLMVFHRLRWATSIISPGSKLLYPGGYSWLEVLTGGLGSQTASGKVDWPPAKQLSC